jgi:hypothetical protein
MNCPVCLKAAKDASPPAYRGLVVECSRCGIYRVTQNAIASLGSLRVEERTAALRRAKALLGSRGTPTVTSGCLPHSSLSPKIMTDPANSVKPRMQPSYGNYLWLKQAEKTKADFSGLADKPSKPSKKPAKSSEATN